MVSLGQHRELINLQPQAVAKEVHLPLPETHEIWIETSALC